MTNYMVLNMADGVYTYTFNAERRTDCLSCSHSKRVMEVEPTATLQAIYDTLCSGQDYLMKSPGLCTHSLKTLALFKLLDSTLIYYRLTIALKSIEDKLLTLQCVI